jgi:hypothetical protein
LTYHEAVVAATTANLVTTTGGTITYAQPNGAGNGIGATITTTGSFNLIDTANVQTLGTRILVKNEGNAVLNGVYTWSNATVIVRSTDADEWGPNDAEQLSLNSYFFVSSGNVNLGSAYVVDAPQGVITFGTSNIQFAQFSQAQIYSANTSAGLSLTGQTFSAKVDNITTAFDGAGNIIVKASANLTTPNIGAATGTSLNTTGNVTGGNVLTGGLVTATGNVTGGNVLTAGFVSAAGTVTGSSFLGSVVSVTANVTGGNLLTAGLISATSTITSAANITGGNLLTGGLISSTGTITSAANITGGNVLTGGAVSATANITGGNVLTGGLISATSTITSAANITGGNVLTGGLVSATANVTGGNLLTGGVVSATANITGGNVLTGGLISATSTITSAANITGGNILTGGLVSATANVTGGNILTGGAVTATANITGGNVLTGGLISATSTITSAANVTGGNLLTAGIISATGNIRGGNVTASNFFYANGVAIVGYSASTSPPANPNAGWYWYNTSTDVLYEYLNDGTTDYWVDVSSPAFSNGPAGDMAIQGNLLAGANATYNIGSPASTFNNVYAQNYYGNGATLTGIITSVSNINNGTSNITVVSSGGNITTSVGGTANIGVWYNGGLSITGDLTVTGNATLTGNILGDRIQNGTTSIDIQSASGNANITIGATSNVAVFTTAGMTILGNIENGGSNGTGNIGSATTYFNTIFGKATTAQYADLAENYLADAAYTPGTVLEFDGEQEVTISTRDSSKRVAGVVSTNPAHLMNATLDGAHVVAVALVGRVPTQVTGNVVKGDLMVSAGNGRARAEANPAVGTVIGKALENFGGGEGTIEIVICMQ